jgi:hypothetical protein
MMGTWNGLHFVWFRGRLVLFLSWADKLKRKRTKKRGGGVGSKLGGECQCPLKYKINGLIALSFHLHVLFCVPLCFCLCPCYIYINYIVQVSYLSFLISLRCSVKHNKISFICCILTAF